MAQTFPTLASDAVTYTASDVAKALRKAGRTKVDASDVRAFVREHAADLTGEEWSDEYTRHVYSPDLARDVAAAMLAPSSGAAPLVAKRERAKPEAPTA